MSVVITRSTVNYQEGIYVTKKLSEEEFASIVRSARVKKRLLCTINEPEKLRTIHSVTGVMAKWTTPTPLTLSDHTKIISLIFSGNKIKSIWMLTFYDVTPNDGNKKG